MVRQLDETAAERDFQIKLGFASWIYMVWAYLAAVAAFGLVLVLGSLCARLVSASMASAEILTFDFLLSFQNFVSQTFTVLVSVSCIAALPIAFVLRLWYRRRLLASIGVVEEEAEEESP